MPPDPKDSGDWRAAFEEVLVELRQLSPGQGGGDGWEEWKNHIRLELKRLSQGQKEMLACQADIQAELPQKADALQLERHKADTAAQLSALKVRAGIWGALGASIPATVAILYALANR